MKAIEIVRFKDEKIIHSLDVTGKREKDIDKIDSGMNINLNHELYFTRIT